ncbi:MAG TPA: NnrS family protein [Methylophilaceae bacterium]
MLVQPTETSRRKTDGFALLHLGFRPFFLGAAVFSLLSMTVWILSYARLTSLDITLIAPMQWHAHEMLYGYGLAVIAGFLLTAVKNWTGVQTVHGIPLFGLFMLWALARLLMLGGTSLIPAAAMLDSLFGLLLMVAVAYPIVRARQWKQLVVVSKLVIIVIGNGLFYLGILGDAPDLVHISLYGALYLIISLIMVIGRRVIPFFIERGVREPVRLRQHRWLDIGIMLMFVLFFINELFIGNAAFTPCSAGLLFILNGMRLINWHTPGIWQAPLLWGLYVSAWLINAGFMLMALQSWFPIPPVLAVHLFTIGGIGLMTLSMMARVALGHSGRDIRMPPEPVGFMLGLIVLSALLRVGLPLIDMQRYLWWVVGSYLCWVAAFAIFVLVYAPILVRPRIDGRPG